MKQEFLDPLLLVEKRLEKSKKEIAVYCGVNLTSVYRWSYNKRIKAQYQPMLIQWAKELNIPLSGDEVIFGGFLSIK